MARKKLPPEQPGLVADCTYKPQARRATLDALLDTDPALVDRLLLAARTHAPEPKRKITRAHEAVELLLPHLVGHQTERLVGVLFDARNSVICTEVLSTGSDAFTIVCPRTLARWALTRERVGRAILIAHNHPSGDPEPSSQDLEVTAAVNRAMRAIGMLLLDHIVIAGAGSWVSLAERGQIPQVGAVSAAWTS